MMISKVISCTDVSNKLAPNGQFKYFLVILMFIFAENLDTYYFQNQYSYVIFETY